MQVSKLPLDFQITPPLAPQKGKSPRAEGDRLWAQTASLWSGGSGLLSLLSVFFVFKSKQESSRKFCTITPPRSPSIDRGVHSVNLLAGTKSWAVLFSPHQHLSYEISWRNVGEGRERRNWIHLLFLLLKLLLWFAGLSCSSSHLLIPSRLGSGSFKSCLVLIHLPSRSEWEAPGCEKVVSMLDCWTPWQMILGKKLVEWMLMCATLELKGASYRPRLAIVLWPCLCRLQKSMWMLSSFLFFNSVLYSSLSWALTF